MLYKEFEKNREDILENEFCMQSNASTLPITDCPSYTPICTIGICIQGNAKNKNGFSRIYYTPT